MENEIKDVTATARMLRPTLETMRYRVQKDHLNMASIDIDYTGVHLPPVPLCAFVLEPEVQVGTGPINQASRLNGHAHH